LAHLCEHNVLQWWRQKLSFFVEVWAASQKVTDKSLDEVTERPHNSASLLLQTKRFASKETGESQRILVLIVL
jgi:hypothetical protein